MKRNQGTGDIIGRDGYDGFIDRDAIATRDTHGGLVTKTGG